MYAVSESVLLNYGSFLSIHFKILELQMESSCAIKFSNLWKEYMKVLEETKWAFDLTLRNPVEKFFKSSPVYKFIRSFKIQNKINTARS